MLVGLYHKLFIFFSSRIPKHDRSKVPKPSKNDPKSSETSVFCSVWYIYIFAICLLLNLPAEARPDAWGGVGVYATEPIRKGDVVERGVVQRLQLGSSTPIAAIAHSWMVMENPKIRWTRTGLHMVGNGVDRTPEMGVISLTYTWYSEL